MKRYSRILGSMIGLATLPLLLACSDEPPITDLQKPEPRLEVYPSNAAIDVGKTIRLKARLWGADGEMLDADYAVDWSSSRPEVLHVTETGLATGMAPGTAIITAEGVALSDWTRVSVRRTPVGDLPPGDDDRRKKLPHDEREEDRRDKEGER
jgi:hypothetical protein